MTPGARYQAVIELLDALMVAPGAKPPAMDRAIKAWFRERRYAGSKDRRFVRDVIWDICRQRGLLMGKTGQSWDKKPNPRLLVAAWIYLQDGETRTLDSVFTDARHHPVPLSDAEKDILSDIDNTEPPDWAWVNLPPFLDEMLAKKLGKSYSRFLAAMDDRAGLVLRVNPQKTDRDALLSAMTATLGGDVQACSHSVFGIHVPTGTDIVQTGWYKDGLVEIQDEAAQLACQYAGLQPGQKILDYCAGGGGKALAIAALVPDHGGIDVFDVNQRRMQDIPWRAGRAGADDISVLDAAPQANHQYDQVLIDVPCSGSGVWRRHPDDRWRWSEQDIQHFVDMQAEILDRVTGFVKPGGHIIYMTCSVLPSENDQQIQRFLQRNRAFSLADIDAPTALLQNGQMVLRPDLHLCDGFFMARLMHSG